jgi:phosphoribosylaminoimidazole-succinocarboxamide synthase
VLNRAAQAVMTPGVIKMQKQAELYRGKAKTVYSTENPDLLVLEFRNDTSAGDGARIEQFERKGDGEQ